ncbi:MAG: hypothetical protein R2827_14870 [Bdellovibrionales bacterium]
MAQNIVEPKVIYSEDDWAQSRNIFSGNLNLESLSDELFNQYRDLSQLNNERRFTLSSNPI